MRTHFGALLDDADGGFEPLRFCELHDTNRGAKASRARSNDDDVKFHGFSFHTSPPVLYSDVLGLSPLSLKCVKISASQVLSQRPA